jgi:large subunit ribosomal protein L15
MKIQELSPAPNSKTSVKRVGRGTGSGSGKTSGRGMKGQNSRSGGGVRPGFEGGQIPLIRKLPKRGFHNMFRKEYAFVNLDDLNKLDEETVVTEELLLEKGIIGKKQPYGLKVLGNGDLIKALTVKANKFSKSAVKKIEASGGKIEVL